MKENSSSCSLCGTSYLSKLNIFSKYFLLSYNKIAACVIVPLCKIGFHIYCCRNLADKVVAVLKNFLCCVYAVQLPFHGIYRNLGFQTQISRKPPFSVKKSGLGHVSQTPTPYLSVTSQRMLRSFSCIGNCGVEMEYFLKECQGGDTSS